MTSVLQCDRVSKSYSHATSLGVKEWFVSRRPRTGRFTREWALRDVTFAVHAGEGFGVVGANGSGKSTLLGVLLGVLQPEAGSVRTEGRVASLLELGAGFHPELTGRQNLFLYGVILGLRLREIRARYDAIVDFSELGSAIDQPLRTYSSGMVTRLGFATVAHARADILLVDEVLAVGDLAFQDKCRGFMTAFKARGGSLVVVSHDLTGVQTMCERGICLDQGCVQTTGAMREVVDFYTGLAHRAGDPAAAAG